MSLISNEIPYQLPQDLSRSTLLNGGKGGSDNGNEQRDSKDILADDAVDLRQNIGLTASPQKISVDVYKDAVGKDAAFVKETLRNKVAEVGMNPEMKLEISKDLFGNFQAKGNGIPSAMEQINKDLNNNKAFRDAFNRLSTEQPTLDYVDNVVKVANAYGVTNKVFSNLVSSSADNNGLSDIAHRYSALKDVVSDSGIADDFMMEKPEEEYRFMLNA